LFADGTLGGWAESRTWSNARSKWYIFRMPTYVYETISPAPERFEVRQHFDDPALVTHPETGEPVRRVVSGGLAVLPKGRGSTDSSEPGCGPANCQCGRFN
jgi:predicted nucleic acid-binding Zn ribbon protein